MRQRRPLGLALYPTHGSVPTRSEGLMKVQAVLLTALLLAACKPIPRSEAQQTARSVAAANEAEVAISGKPRNGPLGIAEGEPMTDLKGAATTENPGQYKLSTVPTPYPGVDFYWVKASAKTGACMVKAIGQDVEGDSQGSELRSTVDHVKDDLVERYGPPTANIDYLQSGSIWHDPQDWMMAVAKNERNYGYIWERKAGADSAIWRGIQSVGVFSGSSGTKGWFILEYDFDNMKDCDAALKGEAAKSL